MKLKIIALITALAATLGASAQTNLYKTLAKIPDVTSVYISKTMIDLGLSSADDMDFSKLKGKLGSIEILTSEESKGCQALQREFEKHVGSNCELLMKTSEPGSEVTIYMKKQNKQYEYYLLNIEPDEANLIIFTGTMSPEEIISMVKTDNKK